MILYHGSNIEVSEPKIITSDVGRDFGFAFYLTPIQEQAERWAKRKTDYAKSGKPIVSMFEWDENTTELSIKEFKNQNEDWLDLIIQCRSNTKYRHDFDVVIGKIADDTVGETITYVLIGIMRKEDALKKLKFQKINSQYAFCTEKALASLTFLHSFEVK